MPAARLADGNARVSADSEDEICHNQRTPEPDRLVHGAVIELWEPLADQFLDPLSCAGHIISRTMHNSGRILVLLMGDCMQS